MFAVPAAEEGVKERGRKGGKKGGRNPSNVHAVTSTHSAPVVKNKIKGKKRVKKTLHLLLGGRRGDHLHPSAPHLPPSLLFLLLPPLHTPSLLHPSSATCCPAHWPIRGRRTRLAAAPPANRGAAAVHLLVVGGGAEGWMKGGTERLDIKR